ncbi:carboxymuconolactone decarboxylase family protein [Micromonospora sp. WMMD882]|uniref:carboxymuconolactone decarboxylase family protein n=1 Tax=Micromonospora sp. WMMD882 TaxID=3015151 RepID=UPI00248ACD51|nr:carboxymuconolactone decarboxylase family protein [Micromonospora sp. WMMD882]WBB80689.1 carboxymuconolactone decarboxylase family protein [Micromonospora sp. WMMD882]
MLASRVVSSVVQRQVKYVTPVPPAEAGGVVAAVYAQAAEEQRLVTPPLLLHSPAPDTLAAYWMLMREPLMTGGVVDRMAKEAVAAAVSVSTICPYCVDMHSAGMYADADADDAEAIVADRVENVADPRIRRLATWARNAHLPDTAVELPLTGAERAELVGVVVGFHYLTRMVNVFLSSFLVPPRLTPAARRRVKHGIGRLLGRTLRESYEPGRSVSLLPAADLPDDAAWAAGNEAVAEAAARSYAALGAAGGRSLSPVVRALVLERLRGWRGEETGLSRQWCEDLVDGLPEPDRAAGRLTLLTALASYQVDEEVVTEFRRHHPEDRALVEAVAWASFVTARQIGAYHLPPGGPADH